MKPTTGNILPRDVSQGLFPFEAFGFDLESANPPVLTLNSPWKLAAAAWVSGTAAALATLNAVVPMGAIAFETDTISVKIGDGATTYNSLTYMYRGLPVPGEPSLGTPHPHEYQAINAVTAPGTYTIDVSAQYPVGTTQIYYTGLFQAVTINTRVLVRSVTSMITGSDTYLQAVASVASFSGIVRLNSARTFEVVVQVANATLTLVIHEYWA